MKTKLEQVSDDRVKISVTIPAEDVDAAIKKTYRDLAKKYKFPGFRPGHAPRRVVDNMMGGSAPVLADATEKIINDSFPLAVDEKEALPVGKIDFDETDSVEDGKDFTYGAEFNVRPSYELSSVEDITIELPPTKAADDEIARQIEMIREQFASLEPADDRPVQENDFALISFVGDVDGEPYEGNTVDKYLYELGRGNMPPDFDKGLLGMKVGETKRIEFTIPEGNENEEFVGKKAGFDVTVHEIKAKVLPELDDEFAKNAGLETFDELREEVSKQIETQKEQMASRAKENKAVAALAERLKVDEVPEDLVTVKADDLLKDFYRTLQEQNIDPAKYFADTGTTFESLMEDMKLRAADIVKEELALEALFRAKDMDLTDADIDDEFRKAVGEEGDPAKLRESWEKGGMMTTLKEGVRRVKALHWLLDNVKVEEQKPQKKGSASASKKSAAKKGASKKSSEEKKVPAKKKTSSAKKAAEKKSDKDE